MSDEAPLAVNPACLLIGNGQRWIAGSDVEKCGYAGALGEVIRVRGIFGRGDTFYELAALIPAFKAGFSQRQDLVWWLLPRPEITAIEAAVSSVSERG